MKMLLKKCVAVVVLTYSIIVLCNYYVDTANIFHTDILVDIAEKLHGGQIVENPGNIDEGLFQKTMIQSMTHTPRIISFVSKISALYTKLIFLFTTKYFSMKLDFLMLQ